MARTSLCGFVSHRYCKLCALEDFADPELAELMREAFTVQAERFGPSFPAGVEYRKYWEVAVTLRALRDFGVLHVDAELLGVGAAAEATLFWLTRHVRRVFATDLYIDNEAWATQTPPGMLLDPAQYAPCTFAPRRLVVQHMNALDLRYEDAVFDGVFSSGSVEHFGDRAAVRRAFGEIHRVLRPGGIAALSTEYRLAGAGDLPGTLLFDEVDLYELWEGLFELVEPLDMRLSPRTRSVIIDFDEAAADARAGRSWSRYPHIVPSHQGRLWTSVHVALRRLA
jgi:SAM-dependent methyltransferase